MRLIIRCLLLGLMSCTLLLASLPALASEAEDTAAILAAEAAISAAFERGDADWLERNLDPSFTLTGSTGTVTTAAQEAADLRSGTRYDVFRNRDTRVRLYGDAAVTTGITRVEGRSEGKPYAVEFQFTDTWIRKPQGWVIVASHASRLAP
jgi:ketosteroid isomerase-like protein